MSAQSESMQRAQTLDPQVRCYGKQKFRTFGLATGVAKAGNRRRDINYTAYRCKTCSYWHTGTAPKGARRNLEARRHKREVRAIREGEHE